MGLGSLAVFALHGTDGMLSRDLGIYAYAGQQVADGVPPYVGVLNRAGPLAHVLPGLGVVLARLGGLDDLFGIRLLYLAFAVACVVLVHLLGRDLFGSPWAGLAAAASFLSFSGFIMFATGGPREKTPMLLFLLLALLAAGRRRWLTAGLFLGLATLVLQTILTVGAPALLVAALMDDNGRARLTACLRILAGGAAVLAATVLYFLAVGRLDEFVQAFVLINAEYTKAAPALVGVADDWGRVVRGYGPSTVILVGGLLALPLLALAAHRRSDPAAPLLTGLSVATLTGVAWMVHDFDSWPDAFPVLPLAALGAGGTVAALARLLGGRRGIALVVAWSLVATGSPWPTPSASATTTSRPSAARWTRCWPRCRTRPSCRCRRRSRWSSRDGGTRPVTRCSRTASATTSTTPGRVACPGSSERSSTPARTSWPSGPRETTDGCGRCSRTTPASAARRAGSGSPDAPSARTSSSA